MLSTYPGTAIEVSVLEKGSSKQLFDSIFVTGGVTLSQVCIMTGIEPYLVQNWVKRGFVSSPKKRLYSESQFARIIIINMLRESLQIDSICELVSITGRTLNDESDDIIKDDVLYHKYVDMLAQSSINPHDAKSVMAAADKAAGELDGKGQVSEKQLSRVLQVMIYAHFSSELRRSADMLYKELK